MTNKVFFPNKNSVNNASEKHYTLAEVKEETKGWADKIVKVDGGWMVFESVQDYNTWKNQK